VAIGSEHTSLEIVINSDQKSLLEAAAARSGEPIASFARSAAVDAARRVVDGHRAIRLSTRDWDRFLQLLDSQADPNDYLKNAAARYKDEVIQ
jgi:uncharacterized protein (DUF1778 family)